MVQVAVTKVPTLNLYQTPNGPTIGKIRPGQILTLLYGKQDLDGVIWVEVMDQEGRIGWIPELYLNPVTVTPPP